MSRKVICIMIAVLTIFAACITAAYGEDVIGLKYTSRSIYKGQTLKNGLTGAKGKVSWTTSNKKIATVSKTGSIKGRSYGKCTITAKCGSVKYKCRIKVIRRQPDYDAKIIAVNRKSGKNYVKVKFRNYSSKPLKILAKAEYNDFTDVTYKVKAKSSKEITIKGKKTRTVTFINYGKYDLYNHAGRPDPDIFAMLESALSYHIRFDGKKYPAITYWGSETDDETGEESYYYESLYGKDSFTRARDRS